MGFLRLFTSRQRDKTKLKPTKKDGFKGWFKCEKCNEMIHDNEFEENFNCCPKCEYHYKLSVSKRIDLLSDVKTFRELYHGLKSGDPLNFVDSQTYKDRISKSEKKTNRNEAIVTGICKINGMEVALGVLDFEFMGGSMGSVVGEKVSLITEYSLKEKIPLILVSSSGGARMQESIYSLMQMAKTSAALGKLHDARIPYISIFTNPTTGGVTASFASLGDILISEPGTLIAFAGPRVVEQTIGQKLPDKAQTSEFLLEKGMIDCIVKRSDLKKKVSFFIKFLVSDTNVSSVKKKHKDLERLDDLLECAQQAREKNIIDKI